MGLMKAWWEMPLAKNQHPVAIFEDAILAPLCSDETLVCIRVMNTSESFHCHAIMPR